MPRRRTRGHTFISIPRAAGRHQGDVMSDSTGSTGRPKGRPRSFDRDRALNSALAVFWQHGYEPSSVAMLCKAMRINPPSLYATFGTKADLFLEAVTYYERTYWDAPARRFMEEPDVHRAVDAFFEESVRILLAPESPCGCMVVVAAVNISQSETRVIERLHSLREDTRRMFADRLERARAEEALPADTPVEALATALNTFLEGLSLQARDGRPLHELLQVAGMAALLLPRRA